MKLRFCPRDLVEILEPEDLLDFIPALARTNPPPASAPPAETPEAGLPVGAALRVRSAALWLRLGNAGQALQELDRLPRNAWNHPAALRTRMSALEALRRAA